MAGSLDRLQKHFFGFLQTLLIIKQKKSYELHYTHRILLANTIKFESVSKEDISVFPANSLQVTQYIVVLLLYSTLPTSD